MDYRQYESCSYLAILAFLIIISYPSCQCMDGQPLVRGGSEVTIEYFPYHVGIYSNAGAPGVYKQICGGTLISKTLVVSAAHCFWDDEEKAPRNSSLFRVAAGKTHRTWRFPSDDNSEQRLKVAKVTLPERYIGSAQSYSYDIAIVTLRKAVRVTKWVVPAAIDWRGEWTDEQLVNGNNGTVAGWGRTEAGLHSDTLRFVNLPYVDPQTCFDSLPKRLKALLAHDKFCAGFLNRNTSVCPGDSGGGLVFHHEGTGKNFLRGIVSLAFKPGDNEDKCYAEHYAAFTMVTPKILRELKARAGHRGRFKVPRCGQPASARGHKDAEDELHWHAAVYEDFAYVCGGSLIAEKFVITAAHCFHYGDSSREKDFRLFRISLGAIGSTYDDTANLPTSPVQTFRVAALSIHPDYIGSTGNFAKNIAVVRLARPAVLTPTVAPVCVDWDNAFDGDLRDGAVGVVPGFGDGSSKQSDSLRWIQLPYVNLEKCAASVRGQSAERLISAPNFCVGSVNKSSESCRSDAGGGFGVRHEANRRCYLRGVVVVALGHKSRRVQCYSDGFTLVQAIAPFVKWIRGVMAMAEPGNT